LTEVSAPLPEVEPEIVLLTHPADGVPEVVATQQALQRTIESLVGGSGPLAVDAERAHGFRYSQRAYLIQLRRAGASTHLIDPIAFGEPAAPSPPGSALAATEWISHAASQD
jgi:ribonuclease D